MCPCAIIALNFMCKAALASLLGPYNITCKSCLGRSRFLPPTWVCMELMTLSSCKRWKIAALCIRRSSFVQDSVIVLSKALTSPSQ